MKHGFLIVVLAMLAIAGCAKSSIVPPQQQLPAGAVGCTDPRPEICTMDYNPVCGSTGQTYGNSCGACADTNVDWYVSGACPGDEEVINETPEQPVPPVEDQFTDCTDPRPEACTKEYMPVCGAVDNGIRCITQPCPSNDWVTFGNKCEACANPKTSGYNPGACNPEVDNNPADDTENDTPGRGPNTGAAIQDFMVCTNQEERTKAEEFGFHCVEACPQTFDEYSAKVGTLCISHMGEKEIAAWPTCKTANDCTQYIGQEQGTCALADTTTDGKDIAKPQYRCVAQAYRGYKLHTGGLATIDENGKKATAVA